MSTSDNFYKDDLYQYYNIVQNSHLTYIKSTLIWTLRDFFSKSAYFHYSVDNYGFPLITDHTNLPPGADLPSGYGSRPDLSPTETLTTRLFIGEAYSQKVIFYPAIIVKNAGSKYVPLSATRNSGTVQYEHIIYEDGYGNQTNISRPSTFVTAGSWEGNYSIDVITRSQTSRDSLVSLIAMCFTEVNFDSLVDIGVIIKPITIGSPNETEDRNDKLFRQTLNLEIRSEWRREIPISTLIDAVVFSVEFANLEVPDPIIAQNLTIKTEVNLDDVFE